MENILFQAIPIALRDDIEAFVEYAVDQRLAELLGDPDQGLEVREELLERLRDQQKQVAAGELGRPMSEVMKVLGLEHE